jgi:hypothetical protein
MAAASGSVLRPRGGQHAVDDQVLLRQADGGQFGVGARRLAQGGRCARATSTRRVRAGSARASTAALYWLRCFSRPGQRPEAGGVALALFQKAAPRARQLQQADGVAGGRGVENDVVVIGASAPHRSAGR